MSATGARTGMAEPGRRKFLRDLGLAAIALGTGAGAAPASAMDMERFGQPLAFQAFSLRSQLATRPKQILRTMRSLGFRHVELASFIGWRGYAYGDFGALADLSGTEVRQLLKDADLTCQASHFRIGQCGPDQIDDTLRFAGALGLQTLVAAQLELPGRPGRDEVAACYERLSAVGRRVRAAGFGFAVHTEGFFWRRDLGFDVEAELAHLDSSACNLQLDLGSATQVGSDIPALIRRHGPRIASIHLRDAKKPTDPDQYLPAVALGDGVVDLRGVIQEGLKANVRQWVLEIVTFPPGEEPKAYERSLAYLRALEI